MGDYDVTLVRAIAQVGKMDVEELKAFYCTSDEPEVSEERAAKFDDRLKVLEMLGIVVKEGNQVIYLGSL